MGIVGKSLGATRNITNKARSSGGYALKHVKAGMEGYAAGHGGMVGRSLGAMAKRPGLTMGIGAGAAAAAGYGLHRHRARGSQNRALGPIGPMDQ